jgi:integrase
MITLAPDVSSRKGKTCNLNNFPEENMLSDSTYILISLLDYGFFGAFRRSELVKIRIEHLDWKPEGLTILIPTSKTDQSHQVQFCATPYGDQLLCPLVSLKAWLDCFGILKDPIFREIKKDGKLMDISLTAHSVSHIIRKHAKVCNLSYAHLLSGHSLRRGMASDAGRAGADRITIMRHGRWKSTNTVVEYVSFPIRHTVLN